MRHEKILILKMPTRTDVTAAFYNDNQEEKPATPLMHVRSDWLSIFKMKSQQMKINPI